MGVGGTDAIARAGNEGVAAAGCDLVELRKDVVRE